MSSSPINANKEVFNLVSQKFDDAVINAAGRSAVDFERELKAFMKDYMDRFYDLLFTAGLNGADYAAYRTSYADLKVKKGIDPPNWYEFSGDLKTQLSQRKAASDFGSAVVSFEGGGTGLGPQFKLDSLGRAQYRSKAEWPAGVPDSGKRGMAERGVAFSKLKFTLEVDMYPKIQDKTFRNVFKVYRNKKLRTKFAVTEHGRSSIKGRKANHPARPLLIPFLKAYGGPFLRASLKQRFGI